MVPASVRPLQTSLDAIIHSIFHLLVVWGPDTVLVLKSGVSCPLCGQSPEGRPV